MAKSENKEGWEKSEFPILCETCLGDNPYMRMTKEIFGKECKICARPFTVFRWNPGSAMRFKKTEICQTCAKLKNVCQTCLLDLQYGLPVQVRDTAMGTTDYIPKNDVNRQYLIQNVESRLASGESSDHDITRALPAGKEMLKKLARNEPYYKRNRPHLCSFFLKGDCTRGDECPYRHEKPGEGENMGHQNIKDRYYGSNDPVAVKMLKTVGNTGAGGNGIGLKPNLISTSLFLNGVHGGISEQDLRDFFYAFGDIKSIVVVHKANCAFVNYMNRTAAERAMDKVFHGVEIKGTFLQVQWGRPKSQASKASENSPGGTENSPSSQTSTPVPPPPPGEEKVFYPSQNPTLLGSRIRK